MKTGNGNAPRGSDTSSHVAERSPHGDRSLNIANLPARIRDELNYRISDGEPGNELVEWLNSNPEVVRIIAERFDGTPISEQNLYEWRKRGYQKWLAHRNMFDESNALGDNTEEIAETGIDCDKLLLTLTAAYAEAIQNWIVTPCEQMTYKLAVYKNLTNGVIALQRAELQKVRLEIDRERLELLREKRRNKSASSASSCASASADRVSPEGAASSSPARPESPEPNRSVIPAPSPCEEENPPQEFPEPPLSAPERGVATAGSLPASEESPTLAATAGSLPKPAGLAAASSIPASNPSAPAPQPKPCAPCAAPTPAPVAQPTGSAFNHHPNRAAPATTRHSSETGGAAKRPNVAKSPSRKPAMQRIATKSTRITLIHLD